MNRKAPAATRGLCVPYLAETAYAPGYEQNRSPETPWSMELVAMMVSTHRLSQLRPAGTLGRSHARSDLLRIR